MSTLKANVIQTTAGKPILNSTGSILQVVQTVKTDTYTQNSNTFTDITGLSVSITPSSTSNKILVSTFIPTAVDNTYNVHLRLMRDSTAICVGDAAGSRPRSSWQGFFNTSEDQWPVSIQFLDSPSTTSSVTYKVQIKAGVTCYIGRTGADRDTANYDARTASIITVMEVSG